jgi:hypothetical protein
VSAGYEVAIPSSNRPVTLRERTMPVLLDGGVPPDAITVWVPDEGQAASYREALRDLPPGIRLTSGHGPGVRQARNAIARGYPPGTRLVQVDDDIYGLSRYVDEKTLAPLGDVDGFIRHAFDVAGDHLWCVYPVANPYFMRPTRIRRGGLWYAIACFYGYTVTGSPAREIVRLDDKEDFERSCRFYEADGEIVRFDWVTMHSRFYAEPGGMQDYRTPATVEDGARRLERMFPHLATAYRARSGLWEIRLRDRSAALSGEARRVRAAR